MTLWQGLPPGLPVGVFAVVTDPAEVAAFHAALGVADPAEVPLTFPLRWLAAPEVRGAVIGALGTDRTPGALLVHLEQRLRSIEPLRLGKTHAMHVTVEPLASAQGLTVHAEIRADGRLACQLSSRFALATHGGAG